MDLKDTVTQFTAQVERFVTHPHAAGFDGNLILTFSINPTFPSVLPVRSPNLALPQATGTTETIGTKKPLFLIFMM
jgi:hypothetical protein